MEELLAEFNGCTSLYRVVDSLGLTLKLAISQKSSIPVDEIALTVDGIFIADTDLIPELSIARVSIPNTLIGGKGGFGALLRHKAKQQGVKKTTDFGACRDLSGRRLRHVNDEILLQKWRDAKESGQEFDVTQPTKTGIDLWFLSAPSWTEGFGKKKHVKKGRKSRICSDWLHARENRSAPEGAPIWWGCPRGRRCEFAHGEGDLQGRAAEALKEKTATEKRDAENSQRRSYVESTDIANGVDGDAAIHELVSSGLKAGKRKRLGSDRQDASDEIDDDDAVSANEDLGKFFNWEWIQVLSGDAVLQDHNVVGVSEFATVGVMPHMTLGPGKWYFEIELLTAGLFQVIRCVIHHVMILVISLILLCNGCLGFVLDWLG